MKLLYVVTSVLLITACNGGDSNGSDQRTSTEVVQCESRVCSDNSGDADFSFIDIEGVNIKIEDSNIIVEMKFLDIPEFLKYNSSNVPNDSMEYYWSVQFDVDKNGANSNDIEFSASYYKEPGVSELSGRLIEFTQHDVWQADEKGEEYTAIAPITIRQDSSTLIFTAYKNQHAALMDIDESTPFKVQASYNASGTVYVDNFPNYDGYIK